MGPLQKASIKASFGPDLRSLIISLKYSGNMSEPKIGEFLQNFNIEVSKGSLSNILTKTADRLKKFTTEYIEQALLRLLPTDR